MKPKKIKKQKSEVLGANDELPEGVFGIMDDITPLFKLERLHDTAWENDHRKRADKRRRAKRRADKRRRAEDLPDISVPQPKINTDSYESHVLPGVEFENTIKVPEDLLRSVTRKSTQRTKDLSRLMMNRLLPTMMGLEAAQSYVTSALRDGLGIEVEMDDSVMEASKIMSNIDLVFYFMRRSSLPKSLKRKYMETLIEQLAKDTAESMKLAAVKKDKARASSELQALIVSRQSQMHRQEDNARKNAMNRPRQDNQNESPIGVVEDAPRPRNGAGLQRSRRDPHMR